MIKTGIVGATGYTGAELLRLLSAHPEVEIAWVTSRAEAGRRVDAFFPGLRGHVNLEFGAPDAEILSACDAVFFATPTGTAMQSAPALLESGVRVIDLSADFRLKDAAVWERWYGRPHACPDLLEEAVYGLPEINRAAIRAARLVANPGCYPTAVILGFLPLLESGLVDAEHLIANAASGVSGAGRKAAEHLLLAEAGDNLAAYAVPGHRHRPEIALTLAAAAGGDVGLTFVPHLAPMIRGLHATLHARLKEKNEKIGGADLQAVFELRYEAEPFVDVLPAGSHPQTRSVRGANVCRIAVHRPADGDTVVVLAVIDNLVKGAAGQAVQNMNLMFGLDETTGLTGAALSP